MHSANNNVEWQAVCYLVHCKLLSMVLLYHIVF